MWIFASADNGKSPYPGSNSCGDGCRGMSTVTTSTVTFNQEYYSMAHFARAFTSDDGSTLGKRIQASVSDSTFNVVAYATGDKYSLVVLNSMSSLPVLRHVLVKLIGPLQVVAHHKRAFPSKGSR